MNKPALLAVALAALLGGLGWLLLGGEQPAQHQDHLALSEAAAAAMRAGLDSNQEQVPSDSDNVNQERSAVIVEAAGVRVAGDGQLVGQVVERESGQGAGNVEVSLFTYPPQGSGLIGRVMKLGKTSSSFAKRALPIANTRTDGTGHFKFSDVRSGSFYAEARGELFIPDPIVRVTLAPSGSETILYVRAGGRIEGRVLLSNGKPAKGARVHVGHGERRFIQAVRTGEIMEKVVICDKHGFFSAGGIPAGTGMQVSAARDDAGLVFANDLTVTAGEVLRVELAFAAPAGFSGRVVSVSGEEEDESKVLGGARLAVVPRGLREMQFVDEVMQASAATSSAKGAFTITALPSGSVDLLAWAPGHKPARIGPLPSSAGLVFDVGTISLERGPMVSGRVVDADDEPIEGVQIRWRPVTLGNELELSFAPMLSQAIEGFEFPVSDVDGRFEAGPFPGNPQHRMDFYADGFAPARAYWSGSTEEQVSVVMFRGAAVSGLVLDATTKKPVTRFTISGADRLETGDGGPAGWNPFGSGQLVEDAKGRFRVPAVSRGESSLDFSAEGYQTRRLDDIKVIEGEDSAGILVLLEPGATVRGVVVDGEGEPVAGVRVAPHSGSGAGWIFSSVETAGDSKSRGRNVERGGLTGSLPSGFLPFAMGLGLIESSLTDEAGKFELRGLGPGTWKLIATHRDFARGTAQSVKVVLKQREPAPVIEDVVITMQVGSRLVGTVRDGRGTKLPGAIVVAFAPPDLGGSQVSGGAYQAVADAQGEYVMENMIGGGYFLVVTRGDEHLDPFSFLGTMQLDLVTMPYKGELRRDLVDHSAAATQVLGVVYRAGEAVQGGTVFAFNMDSESMLGADVKLASVGRDGAYAFPGLTEGLYQFRYQDGGDMIGREVEVPDRASAQIDLHLPDGVISGLILDAGSRAGVQGARVLARPLDGGFELEGMLGAMLGGELGVEYDYTGGKGDFLITNLQSGTYSIEVVGPRWGDMRGKYRPAEPIIVEVAEGMPPERLTIELEPSLEISGQVRSIDGSVVKRAYITALASGPGAMQDNQVRARSDSNGAFVLRGVGHGTYDLLVEASGFAEASMQGVIVGGEPVEVVLWPGVEVKVRVLDSQGQPAVGATAQLVLVSSKVELEGSALKDWFRGRGVAGLDGTIEMGRFAPGSYRLEASRNQALGVIELVEVTEVGAVNLEVRLQ